MTYYTPQMLRCAWQDTISAPGEAVEFGPECGAPAVRAVVWPGSEQWSPICANPEHTVFGPHAPKFQIVPLTQLAFLGIL